MKKRVSMIAAAFLVVVLAVTLAACGSDTHKNDLMLHLSFDEGDGVTVKDASGNLPDVEMNYEFTHAAYMDSQDPQWREDGISGGCLLLDGTSTYVTYNRNDIMVEGKALTVQAWIAPRTFEWDDPHAAENGTDSPTGIVSQSDKANNKGFILGYERFGRLTFQVGTGDDWLTVWSNGDNLKKYEWNLVTATFDADAGEMCLYLNDTLAASRSVPAGAEIAGAKKTLVVGRNIEGERLTAGFLNVASGYIDEFKMYSTALTADEISDYYAVCWYWWSVCARSARRSQRKRRSWLSSSSRRSAAGMPWKRRRWRLSTSVATTSSTRSPPWETWDGSGSCGRSSGW